MSYHFTSVNPTARHSAERLSYDGPLSSILDRLRTPGGLDAQGTALDCARFLQGIIEYKVDQGSSVMSPERIQQAAMAVKAFLFDGSSGALTDVLDATAALPAIGTVGVRQIGSSFVYHSIQPKNCDSAARRLYEHTGTGNLLIMALGGNGILPALQTAVCLDGISKEHSVVYPLRFSHIKRADKQPFVTSAELVHLQKVATGREVVVFDDTIGMGGTMSAALDYFTDALQRSPIYAGWALDANGIGRRMWPNGLAWDAQAHAQ